MRCAKKTNSNKNLSNKEDSMYSLYKEFSMQLGFNYLFYSLENIASGQSFVFSTDPEWKKHFIENKMIENCPLYLATLNCLRRKRGAFFWNQVVPVNDSEREVINLRAEHGIANGLSITETFGEYRSMLGLGVEPKNFDFENAAKQEFNKYLQLFYTINESCVEKDI